MKSKSYWTDCVVEGDRFKDAIKAWFAPMCDNMVPYKAEILCDIETDAEKKLRAFMTDKDGTRYRFVRTRTVKGFTISMKRLVTNAS